MDEIIKRFISLNDVESQRMHVIFANNVKRVKNFVLKSIEYIQVSLAFGTNLCFKLSARKNFRAV